MEKTIRINKVLAELNISLERAVEYLQTHGFVVEARPTTKISDEEYNLLCDVFQTDRKSKVQSDVISEEKKKEIEAIRKEQEREKLEKIKKEEEEKMKVIKAEAEKLHPKVVGKIDLNPKRKQAVIEDKPNVQIVEKTPDKTPDKTPEKAPEKPKIEEKIIVEEIIEKPKIEEKQVELKPVEIKEDVKPIVEKIEPVTKEIKEPKKQLVVDVEGNEYEKPAEVEHIKTEYQKLTGPKIAGEKMDLSKFNKPKIEKGKNQAGTSPSDDAKKKRKRIMKKENVNDFSNANAGANKPGNTNNDKFKSKLETKKKFIKEEPSEEDVKKQVQETLEKLQGKGKKATSVKYRKQKRDYHRQLSEHEIEQREAESSILKVTEFVTVSELATMMEKQVTQLISACMTLGIMVTMNQRLDAETLTILADEFGYTVEFVSADIEESIQEMQDAPEDLKSRAPIITIMGHVDHGKTSLLDYIRKTNVIAGEAGGITQHIAAYNVKLKNGQHVTFLDTPGHEAFTAMRARGAQVTDIVVIVIAADDAVMPQTKEAISHAQAAGVPIVFAINKIDKPNANPEKIKEQLSAMNLLVEDWGGKIQSQEISAKSGLGVEDLMDKVLLEAEILELQANPNKDAIGTVIEAQLDKGKGFIATLLVEAGTLIVGDYLLAGSNSGKIKALFDERGNKIKEAGPSMPILVLGLDGAPQAGDRFHVFKDEREAKQIANKRAQLQREQSVRTMRHITLDEIGRRIALGDFKELNIILKGDVDGSVEALFGSLQKLSTPEIQINIIHKGVGAITESDVLLASASDAIIIGFNVRPAGPARLVADREEIDVRTYSIIYDAINDVKDAMEGMLSPEIKEEITGTAEIREIFKVTKVGNIAGCMVTDGKIFRKSFVRVIRDGIVIFTGELDSLKRFKDDAKEVSKGYDCGMQIKNFNEIELNDTIEAYHEVEVKKKLKK
jgi:translation initiation factor IF-2